MGDIIGTIVENVFELGNKMVFEYQCAIKATSYHFSTPYRLGTASLLPCHTVK